MNNSGIWPKCWYWIWKGNQLHQLRAWQSFATLVSRNCFWIWSLIGPTVEPSQLHWFVWSSDEAKLARGVASLLSEVTKMSQQVPPSLPHVVRKNLDKKLILGDSEVFGGSFMISFLERYICWEYCSDRTQTAIIAHYTCRSSRK